MNIFTVDIGGTWLKTAVVETATGQISAYRDVTSRSYSGPTSVTEDILHLFNEAEVQAIEPRALGVALGGGPVDTQTGHVRNFTAGIEGWQDYPLAAVLGDLTGLKTNLENDANAAAIGEWRFGDTGAKSVLVYVTWSTGVSAGVVIDGRVMRGAFGTAAELGHVPLGGNESKCICGSMDCLEHLVGGRYIDLNKSNPSDRAVFTRYWGRAFQTVVNLFGPDVVVVGGGMASAGREIIVDSWDRYHGNFLPPMSERTMLKFSVLHNRNVLLGAAALAEQAFAR